MSVRLSSRFAAALLLLGTAVLAPAPGAARPERDLAETPLAVTAITSEELRQTDLAISVLDTINEVRANPPAFTGSVRGLRGAPNPDRKDAADFLQGQNPLPALEYHPMLSDAARRHARDIGPLGLTSHTGSDGSTPGVRIDELGQRPLMIAELLSFGQTRPVDSVIQLIVDPGLPQRPHRRDLFNPVFTHAGVGCAPHQRHRQVCVIVLGSRPAAIPLPVPLPQVPEALKKPPCPDYDLVIAGYWEYANDLDWFERNRRWTREMRLGAYDTLMAATDSYRPAALERMAELNAESDHLEKLWDEWRLETADFTRRVQAYIEELPPECRKLYKVVR